MTHERPAQHERQAQQSAQLDRAVRLFEFLARAQQATAAAPRTYDGYRLAWADDLPRHAAVHFAHWSDAPGPGDEIAHIDRLDRVPPPEPPAHLSTGSVDDPDRAPGVTPDDGAAQRWLAAWHDWADRERIEKPVRDAYAMLFAMQAEAATNPEEQELVLAVGCLVWHPGEHDPVRRHLITTPVAIELEPVSGTLRVYAAEATDPLRIELDMLDSELTGSRHLTEARDVARAYAEHPLHRKAIGELLHHIANSLDSEAVFRESGPPAAQTTATAEVSLSPAIVLRRRDRQGVVELLETIRGQLLESQSVPDGILPLVDPDHRPRVRADPTPGAIVTVDDEVFLPLPVNEQQLEILRQVDRHAQTLVQGPPGTGKTHTAAALLSHLLAQGKRVLVTAQTERALKEVRAKLPEAIRPLSVAVVGASREDLTDLKVAVDTISQRAVDYDEQRYTRTVEHHLMAIDKLRRHLAGVKRRMVDVRTAEISRHEREPYRGTLAAIAAAHRVDEPRYGWIRAWSPAVTEDEPPLSAAKMAEWLRLLRDARLTADEGPAYDALPDPATLVSPAAFAAALAAEADAWAAGQAFSEQRQLPSYRLIRKLSATEKQQLHRLAGIAAKLAQECPSWLSKALTDGRGWRDKAHQVRDLIEQAGPLAALLGSTSVEAPGPDLAALVSQAQHLRKHLDTGGRVTTGLLAAKPVKAARDLLSLVRIDGTAPETVEAVEVFLAWAKLQPLLKNLNHAWPGTTPKTLDEHRATLEHLERMLALGSALTQLDLPAADLDGVRAYAALVDAAAAEDRVEAARTAVEAAAAPINALLHEPSPAPALHEAATAVRERNAVAYSAATHRLVRLIEVRAVVTHRDELAATLGYRAPALRDAIAATPADPVWDERLAGWAQAWAWLVTGGWLARQRPADLNRLQAEAAETESAIRSHVEELAAARAWRHAAAPERITGSARANLQQYGQLVRRLGKGTAKYAAQRRAEIRQAMDRCRPSVPVWIMPIYRVAEQLRVQPDMFDVVIVDEASQAGLSATFLQYLAPTIVVIGDDRQVSPSAVGVDQQDLRNLAAQYLFDDPYRASWQDPQRSLFDEAKMRFSGHIPLVEHRRCVPEIIEFSNRIAYEPERIRLTPVRQYGADRLEPVRPVFVADGTVRGTTDKTNPPEAQAVADRIVACTADPRYDGLTFGVISLRGPHQAKLIESLLLQRLDPAEWARRDLRCGDSADFQGSERDVMFLSMVTAVVPGQRLSPATAETYLQRYNVAASRAKDQMWVFHSIRPEDLEDPEDLRLQLLEYSYEVAAGPGADQSCAVEARSSFEREICDRLTARGFSVLRQHDNLVVVGSDSRLALVCDGDTWSGPDRYEADMTRQRELSRCGWEFFRIAQSAWVLDEAAVLRDLSAALDRRGIRPRDTVQRVVSIGASTSWT